MRSTTSLSVPTTVFGIRRTTPICPMCPGSKRRQRRCPIFTAPCTCSTGVPRSPNTPGRKTDRAIVDQIREALDHDRSPLSVASPRAQVKASSSASCITPICTKALRSFEACCGPAANAILVFGHSLADNDAHVLRCIASGGARNLLVSLYGDPDTPTNRAAIRNAEALAALRQRRRGTRNPLNVTFYDATSARVWGR